MIAFGSSIDGAEARPAPRSAYATGLLIAQKRNYANPDCYARIFAQHARLKPGPRRDYWSAPASTAYKGELWGQCRISR